MNVLQLINQKIQTDLFMFFFHMRRVRLDYNIIALAFFYTQNRSNLFIWLICATIVTNFHAVEANIKSIWLP